MKRLFILMVVTSAVMLALAACKIAGLGSGANTPGATAALTPNETVNLLTPSPTPYNGPFNPLTGMPTDRDISGNRPYAIVINNIIDAIPQQGIKSADIIYELLAEGGITRMMAIFCDISSAGVIGSIRSVRPYFIDLAQGYDAIFIHAGGSEAAYDVIESRNIADIDGVNGSHQEIFYRDVSRRRNMGYEHSLMTSDELIMEFVPTYNFRMEHKSGYKCNMVFADNGTPRDGLDAIHFSVEFSEGKTTSFDYDEAAGLYNVKEYGSNYIDGNDGSQISVTNVLVMKTGISDIPGDTKGRLDTEIVGSGSGYFMCGGKYKEIRWSKSNPNSQFEFTDKGGDKLIFGRGKSYINIIPSENKVEIS